MDEIITTEPVRWQRVAGVYKQCLQALFPQIDYLPPAVPAFLAELLARVSASYYGRELEFVHDVWRVSTKIRVDVGIENNDRHMVYRDKLFDKADGGAYSGKPASKHPRRPTPLEAAIETIRRLRDVRYLEEALASKSMAAVLGGSTSYGRFFNVRGGSDASDLDLLVIIKSFDRLEKLLDALHQVPQVSSADRGEALKRAGEFQKFIERMKEQVAFSTKLRLWAESNDPLLEDCGVTSEYNLSLHVITREGFRRLLLEDAPSISSTDIGNREDSMLDYRESKPSRYDKQRSFSGRARAIQIKSEADGDSFVRATKIFAIDDDDSYYPGMFQNLVLPAFDVRWGDSECRRVVDAFRWKMIDRLRYEQRVHPNELCRLSLAHTRSEVFAPHVVRSVDSSTVLG